jgi:hypothetical protein
MPQIGGKPKKPLLIQNAILLLLWEAKSTGFMLVQPRLLLLKN